MASKKCYAFVSTLPFVKCMTEANVQTLHIFEGAPRATISSTEPFRAPGKYAFEVFMRVKQSKTAVGVLAEGKTTEYMRDTALPEPHVSFGGAGWIHPKELAATLKYKEADKVKIEVNFDLKKVYFYVNSQLAGEDEWTQDTAFPSVSFDGGVCELDVVYL